MTVSGQSTAHRVDSATEHDSASRRILVAARGLLARGGAALVSMGDVAAEAGVSKALVHYHFHDKTTLLLAVLEDVAADLLARERAAMRETLGGAGHALDAYWEWLRDELARGDLRILGALAEVDTPAVREQSRAAAGRRRLVAAEHVGLVYERLGLSPRLPAALIAEAVLAFVDGLAAASALDPARDPRPAFDALWLGLLSLGE